jgi:capsular polysaccharide transport system permease protein
VLSLGLHRTSWEVQRAVIYALVVRELKTRFGGKLIGIFWVLFEPAANIAVLLYIRGVLIERNVGATIDWVTYHVVAMIPYFVFRGCWLRGMEAITSNSGLFSYRQVKPIDAIIARSLLELLIYGTVFVIILSGLGWMGFKFIPDNPLMFFWAVFLFFVIGTAWGCISAVLTHGKPNARMFVRLTSIPMYMLSGVIIPLKQFPPDVLEILMLNPAAQLVETTRLAYFNGYKPPMFFDFSYPAEVAVVSVGLAMLLYHLNRFKLMRRG